MFDGKKSKEKISHALGVGGKLSLKPSEELINSAFKEELISQKELFTGMNTADLAYIIVLLEGGHIPEKDGAELIAALLELRAYEKEFVSDPAFGDLYTNREIWLSEKTTAIGWLGVGRARRESTTTAFQILVRRKLFILVSSLCSIGNALADKAEANCDTLMPDYTYLQAAQPTTFGHYLLSFVFPVLRDLERIVTLFGRVNLSPAGCGSANGSTLLKDRTKLAKLMGFKGLVEHARDAMWQADLPIEAMSVVVASLVNLDRLAEDLMVFSSAEFGVITLSDAHSRSSKIMPQKKNPFALAYIRGLANRAIGVQASMSAAGRTPSGQLDNRMFAYEDVPNMISLNAGAANLMAQVVTELSIDISRGETLCEESFCIASDLAEMLVQESGIDYRTAHRLVGRLSRDVIAENKRTSDITIADLDKAAIEINIKPIEMDSETFKRALDPLFALAKRDGTGGASPFAVEHMIQKVRKKLTTFDSWNKKMITLDEIAEQQLVLHATSKCVNT